MKFVILAILIAYAVAASHPVNHELVNKIKAEATWTPMEPEENPFYMMPLEQIKAMMGTKLIVAETDLSTDSNDEEAFDSRTKWGKKVHEIRNQGQCGSCWAFGASEALSDRLAIDQDIDVVLSPQHLVSCDTGNFGCQGGYLEVAWKFMATNGVVSDECYPYTSGTSGETGTCLSKCQDGSEFELHYANNDITVSNNIGNIKASLMKDGPAEAAFTVYEDFMSYKTGIYKHTSGSMLGGHAIKAVGWGVEKGTKYWIMANSWGTGWGEDGFFRIEMGDCGIDSQITFATAKN